MKTTSERGMQLKWMKMFANSFATGIARIPEKKNIYFWAWWCLLVILSLFNLYYINIMYNLHDLYTYFTWRCMYMNHFWLRVAPCRYEKAQYFFLLYLISVCCCWFFFSYFLLFFKLFLIILTLGLFCLTGDGILMDEIYFIVYFRTKLRANR